MRRSAMKLKARMMVTIVGTGLLATLAACNADPTSKTQAASSTAVPGSAKSEIAEHAEAMLAEGKNTFRFDTFGSEAFWGDQLQLHKAIAGEKNGGVGPGVSPKTALSVGLKVDADALPDALKQQIAEAKSTSTIRRPQSPYSS